MVLFLYNDRAMVSGAGIVSYKRPGFAVQIRVGRNGSERPGPRGLRHEADLPGVIAIVKTIYGDVFALRPESALNADVRKGVAVGSG